MPPVDRATVREYVSCVSATKLTANYPLGESTFRVFSVSLLTAFGLDLFADLDNDFGV